LKRFKDRLDDPERNWKIGPADFSERQHWDGYIHAFEAMLSRCSTEAAPWYVIPANKKWFRDLAVAAVVAHEMKTMDLAFAEPSASIEDMRALYRKEDARQRKG
jgi:polyphosphate kinase 2 (PPK2 family)